jgi:hypothetical protein
MQGPETVYLLLFAFRSAAIFEGFSNLTALTLPASDD